MSPPTSSSSSIPKPSFAKGEIINGSWKVIRELGSGGCGIVYEVERIRGTNLGTRAAMKAETVDANRKYSETLAAEALVLRRMQWSPHFCRLYLAGRPSPDCNIIVMSLVGRPLSWLRRQNPSQRFTLSTVLRLGIQCLEAIEDLHSIGIIHRDIKGSNFAIGQGELCRVVHMIDFGFARFYLSPDCSNIDSLMVSEWDNRCGITVGVPGLFGDLCAVRLAEAFPLSGVSSQNGRTLTRGADGKLHHRYPRRKAPYLGTDRYCSIFVHMRKEQGRRDDLWSFLYMMVEFIVGELPWRSSPYKDLLSLKTRSEEHLLKNCPHEFYAIHDHIRCLDYSHRPNYDLIKQKLREICERKHYMPNDPFDWEQGGRFYGEYLRSIEKAQQIKKQKNGKCKKENKKNGDDKLEVFKFGKDEKTGKHPCVNSNPELICEPSLKLAQSPEEDNSSAVLTDESCEWSEQDDKPKNLDSILRQASTDDDKSWTWDDDGWDLDNKHTTSEQVPEEAIPEYTQFPSIAEEE